jgi:branched-chain amino acid transport system ATP-binding protein
VILQISELIVSYGSVRAVHGVNLNMAEGEVHVILGPNGAGKSSIIKAIAGIARPTAGRIIGPAGAALHRMPAHEICRAGVSWVPEGREVFATLTVSENLTLGAFSVSDRELVEQRRNEMFDLFPILRERKSVLAGGLSGGQQQMLAIARALMSGPLLLLLDEPSLGLAPAVVEAIFSLIREINRAGVSILLVEQNSTKALAVAHRVTILESGYVVAEGTPEAVAATEGVKRAYFGQLPTRRSEGEA